MVHVLAYELLWPLRSSHGGLRAYPEREPVGAWLDDLLRDVEVRQPLHRAQQGHLALPQLEGAALGQVAVQRTLGHQRPALEVAQLTLVLKYSNSN